MIRTMGTLRGDLCLIIIGMRNVRDRRCRENQNTLSLPPPENRTVCEIMWENTTEPDRPQIDIIRRMLFACRLAKARIHALIILNICWFSTATLVVRTRVNITLYVHCLSRSLIKRRFENLINFRVLLICCPYFLCILLSNYIRKYLQYK